MEVMGDGGGRNSTTVLYIVKYLYCERSNYDEHNEYNE